MPQFGIVNTDRLNLRAAPTTAAPSLAELPVNTQLELIGEATGDWLNVRVSNSGMTGHVYRPYVTLTDPSSPLTATMPATTPTSLPNTAASSPTTTSTASTGTRAQVMPASGLNVRAGAGTGFPVIVALPGSAIVDVLGTQGDWLQVRFNNQTGFAAKQYLQVLSAQSTAGYLSQRPELMSVKLAPETVIPATTLSGGEIVVARTWNQYGGLVGKLATLINVPRDTVVAVLAAESGGNAFGSDNRMIIRFEVHIFNRYWGANNQEVFNRHFRFDTSSGANSFRGHQWRSTPQSDFINFHGNQDLEWQVLNFARSLDDTAALFSISMGAPQIMGFNFARLGYDNVQRMFEAFSRSAHAQLLAMFDFVKGPNETSQAIQALRSNDYLTFAGIYNGAGNATVYAEIISNYVKVFARLIRTAQTTPVTPVTPVTPSTPTTPTTPTTPSFTSIVVAAVDNLNVRAQATTRAEILATLLKNQTITALESSTQVQAKVIQPQANGQFIQIRLDDGRLGYVAAWLVAPADGLTPSTVEAYISSLPDRSSIPAVYDGWWAAQEKLGLPDPFKVLPVQFRTQAQLANLIVNGFGPNSFAAQNWQQFYTRVGGMHNGFDFIVAAGTPLLAVADGIIIRNWPFMANPQDKTVVLWCFLPERYKDTQGRRMMSNTLVAYSHLSKNDIKQELDIVKAGDLIAVSGTPVNQTDNAHLHLELHLLQGDATLRPFNGMLLRDYAKPQPHGNITPFNPVIGFSKPLVKYLLAQLANVGVGQQSAYPTAEVLTAMNAQHLGSLDAFTVAYYRYGTPSVWENRGKRFPDGVFTSDTLTDRIAAFVRWEPYAQPTVKG